MSTTVAVAVMVVMVMMVAWWRWWKDEGWWKAGVNVHDQIEPVGRWVRGRVEGQAGRVPCKTRLKQWETAWLMLPPKPYAGNFWSLS